MIGSSRKWRRTLVASRRVRHERVVPEERCRGEFVPRCPDEVEHRPGRPEGVNAEEWQERTLPGGDSYRVFRRHFDAEELAAEVGGVVLFAGQFYVLVSTAGVS